MRNIRLIVAYDGTELYGYQRQVVGLTVQGALEKALSIVCDEAISVYGASRTDAGVHAKFQVVTFFTEGSIPVVNLPRALIAHLPASIVVRLAEEIPLEWKPRWNIFGKEYRYTIRNAAVEDPLSMRYHWYLHKRLDTEAMKRASVQLEGRHDFSTLQGMNSTSVNPVKTLYLVGLEILDKPEMINVAGMRKNIKTLSSVGLEKPLIGNQEIRIYVIGDGFLYHMVRNIAGLLVDVGLGRIGANQIPILLEKKNRHCIGKTAPAKGLCLEQIFFSETDREKRLAEINRIIQR